MPGTRDSYEWVDLPVGPQPIPAWAKGLKVEWLEGYGNPPGIRLKTDCEAREWTGQVWSCEDGRYMAVHEDGRARCYYHHGAVGETTLNRSEGGKLIPYVGLATSQSDGLAGSHVRVTMKDGAHSGREIALRGPWCGATPAGYVDTAYVNVADPRCGYPPERHWTQRVGTAGLLITEDLFLRLLARFAPECRCARVTTLWAKLEPVRGDWNEPKSWEMERRRKPALAERAA